MTFVTSQRESGFLELVWMSIDTSPVFQQHLYEKQKWNSNVRLHENVPKASSEVSIGKIDDTLATSTWPALAASISGVCPFSLWSSTFAPASNSTRTVWTCPPAQAYINGVLPVNIFYEFATRDRVIANRYIRMRPQAGFPILQQPGQTAVIRRRAMAPSCRHEIPLAYERINVISIYPLPIGRSHRLREPTVT